MDPSPVAITDLLQDYSFVPAIRFQEFLASQGFNVSHDDYHHQPPTNTTTDLLDDHAFIPPIGFEEFLASQGYTVSHEDCHQPLHTTTIDPSLDDNPFVPAIGLHEFLVSQGITNSHDHHHPLPSNTTDLHDEGYFVPVNSYFLDPDSSYFGVSMEPMAATIGPHEFLALRATAVGHNQHQEYFFFPVDLYIYNGYGGASVDQPEMLTGDLLGFLDSQGGQNHSETDSTSGVVPEHIIWNHLLVTKIQRRTSSNIVENNQEEAEICAVCQDEYQDGQLIGKLQCGHCYHPHCIKDWLLRKNVCPLCKAIAINV